MIEILLMSFPAKILTCVVFLACTAAWAGKDDVYMFVDEDGVVHFTNVPDEGRVYRKVTATKSQAAVKIIKRPPAAKSMPLEYEAYVREAESMFGVPAELIRAVMAVESNYNPRAVSRAGAQGLMQLMPGTCEELGVTDPFDPRQSILGGTRYLKSLFALVNYDLELALAAYNAGIRQVLKKMSVPPFPETRGYVKRVLGLYNFFLTSPSGQ